MSLHIPCMIMDLSQQYHDLFKELEVFLDSAPTPFIEIYAQDTSKPPPTPSSFLPISLVDLYTSELFAQTQTLSLPQNIGVLCCNQILHRTPNPHDLLRPLLRSIDIKGYAIIVEVEPSNKNPYPPKTSGVFSYGTTHHQILSYLDVCYFNVIKHIYLNPLNIWIAKWMN